MGTCWGVKVGMNRRRVAEADFVADIPRKEREERARCRTVRRDTDDDEVRATENADPNSVYAVRLSHKQTKVDATFSGASN
jgi:hypothetical protein